MRREPVKTRRVLRLQSKTDDEGRKERREVGWNTLGLYAR